VVGLLLREKQLYPFSDLHDIENALGTSIDVKTLRDEMFAPWFADDDRERWAMELLNLCLKDHCWQRRLRFVGGCGYCEGEADAFRGVAAHPDGRTGNARRAGTGKARMERILTGDMKASRHTVRERTCASQSDGGVPLKIYFFEGWD
jgi:hypothetical protein